MALASGPGVRWKSEEPQGEWGSLTSVKASDSESPNDLELKERKMF